MIVRVVWYPTHMCVQYVSSLVFNPVRSGITQQEVDDDVMTWICKYTWQAVLSFDWLLIVHLQL